VKIWKFDKDRSIWKSIGSLSSIENPITDCSGDFDLRLKPDQHLWYVPEGRRAVYNVHYIAKLCRLNAEILSSNGYHVVIVLVGLWELIFWVGVPCEPGIIHIWYEW